MKKRSKAKTGRLRQAHRVSEPKPSPGCAAVSSRILRAGHGSDAAAKQPQDECPPGDSLSAGGGQTLLVIDQRGDAPVPAESPLSGVRASPQVPIEAKTVVPERLDRLDLIARRRRQAMLAHGDCERRIKAFVRFLLEDAGEPLSKKQPVTAAHVRRFADNLVIVNLMYVRKFLSAWRTQEEKLLCELAQGLPALDWWTSVNGLGVLGYALLVSESGALSNYPDQGARIYGGLNTVEAFRPARRQWESLRDVERGRLDGRAMERCRLLAAPSLAYFPDHQLAAEKAKPLQGAVRLPQAPRGGQSSRRPKDALASARGALCLQAIVARSLAGVERPKSPCRYWPQARCPRARRSPPIRPCSPERRC